MFFSQIMRFGPHGTGEGEAWHKQPVSVSATSARGRNDETTVLPILERTRLIKNADGFLKSSATRFKTVSRFNKRFHALFV